MSEFAVEPIPPQRVGITDLSRRVIEAARAAGAGNCVVVPVTSSKEVNALRAVLYGSRHLKSGERIHASADPSGQCVRVWITTHDDVKIREER